MCVGKRMGARFASPNISSGSAMSPRPDPIATNPMGTTRTSMSSEIVKRRTISFAPCARSAATLVSISVIALSVMTTGMVAFRFGGSAAANEIVRANSEPISLAGRWIGTYGRGGFSDERGCGTQGCKFAYDIVACKDGWCGILLKPEMSCGDVGLHLTAEAAEGNRAFDGRLEITKGAAPFFVQAWRSVKEESRETQLHLVGSTEPKLLLFRRSFPFEARLTRSGEALCPLPQTTS